jgi:hypothetical protein
MRQLATSRIVHRPANTAATGPIKPWVWPLPNLDGVRPCILPTQDPACTDGAVLIGYPDRTSSRDLIPVFAPQDGVITFAMRADRGAELALDHPAGWSTQFKGLEHVIAASTDRFRRRRKVRVQAGEVLGHVRTSLQLRFGLSRLVDGEWIAVDPGAVVHAWPVLPWFADSAPQAAQLAG